jgi:uncharacterized lipoprotein YbaY
VRRLLRAPLAAVVIVLLVACAPPGAGSPSPEASLVLTSGVRGVVLLGPTCGAQSADASPCVTPYAASMVITDESGATVGRIASGSDGRFEISLPPGNYVITPANGPNGVPFAQSAIPVTVVPDEYAPVEVDYDSGIR